MHELHFQKYLVFIFVEIRSGQVIAFRLAVGIKVPNLSSGLVTSVQPILFAIEVKDFRVHLPR